MSFPQRLLFNPQGNIPNMEIVLHLSGPRNDLLFIDVSCRLRAKLGAAEEFGV